MSDGGSWRKGKPGKRGAARGSAKAHWQKDGKPPLLSPLATRRLKLAVLALLLVSLGTAFLVTVLSLPKAVTVLLIEVSELDDRLPPNALAHEDMLRMTEAWKDSPNLRVEHLTGSQNNAKDFQIAFRAALERVPIHGPSYWSRTLVLYITAHGVVDERGQPCLLTSGAVPWDSATWLPIKELLVEIKSSPRLAKLNAKTVILLDAGRIDNAWSAGVLQNGFADRLEAVVREVDEPRLFVVNSTRDDDKGWIAPEIGGTPFGYFAFDGLNGGATSGGAVTLRDLERHLTVQVDGYARRYRASMQRPKLLTTAPAGMDFRISHAGDGPAATLQPVAGQSKRLDEVATLWHEYAALQEADAYREDPQAWGRLQHLMTQLEILPVAGTAYDNRYLAACVEVGELCAGLRKKMADLGFPAPSLALARLPDTPDEPTTKLIGEWQTLLKKDPNTAPPKLDHDVAAQWAWKELGQGVAERRTHEVWQNLLAASTPVSRPEFTEMQFAKFLLRDADWERAGALIAPAIERQRRMEALAALEDPRALHWLRPLLDGIDRNVRSCRDALFVGDPAALAQAERLVGELDHPETGFPLAERAVVELVAAYRVRDRSMALLLPIAHWISIYPELAEREAHLLKATVLLQDAQALARRIDGAYDEKWDSARLEELSQHVGRVAAGISEYQTLWDTTCNDLAVVQGAPSEEVLTRIDAILRTPLLPTNVDDRTALRRRYWEQRWHLVGAGTAMAVDMERLEEAARKPVSTEPFGNLRMLTQLPRHPAAVPWDQEEFGELSATLGAAGPLEIASNATPSELRAAGLGYLEKLGGAVRRRLLDGAGDGSQFAQETANELASLAEIDSSDINRSVPRPSEVRLGLSKAERLLRSAASLWGVAKPSVDGPSPIVRLRSLDKAFYALWHAERVLAEAWAGDRNDAPHFAILGNAIIRSARELYPEIAPYSNRLGDRLTELDARLRGWKPIACGPLQMVKEQTYLPLVVDFVPLGVASADSVAAFRGAAAALYVETPQHVPVPWYDARSEVRALRMGVVPVAPASSSGPTKETRRFRADDLSDGTDGLTAMYLFRGHRYPRPFRVRKGSDAAITYIKPEPTPTRVLVRGGATTERRILFVLDCSRSMESTVGNTTRMAVAQATLLKVAEDKLDSEGDQVGLLLYGHRWWAPKRNEQEDPPAERVKGGELKTPTRDFELVIPVSRMSRDPESGEFRATESQFRSYLRDSFPAAWGYTPLYNSLVYAIDVMKKDAGDNSQIIVITDGDDNPGRGGNELRRSIEDVRQALRSAPQVKMFMAGFSSTPLERITALQGEPNFQYSSASSPDELAAFLDASLIMPQFEVRRDGRRWHDLKRVGETWEEAQGRADGTSLPLEIRLVDARRDAGTEVATKVISEGGESFELSLRSTGGPLVHSRYPRDTKLAPTGPSTATVPAVGDGGEGYYVAAHTPDDDPAEDRLSFRVSVQNRIETNFSPRPKYVFAEIRPIESEKVDESSVFFGYDRDFVPNLPVPMLQFRVAGWPRWANDQAEIQLWFSMAATPPGATVVPINTTQGTATANVAGAEFEIEIMAAEQQGRVRSLLIRERHPGEGPMSPLWLTVSPAADEIRHTFDMESRTVQHRFIYTTDIFPSQAQLVVVPREELKRWTAVPKLRVTLPRR